MDKGSISYAMYLHFIVIIFIGIQPFLYTFYNGDLFVNF